MFQSESHHGTWARLPRGPLQTITKMDALQRKGVGTALIALTARRPSASKSAQEHQMSFASGNLLSILFSILIGHFGQPSMDARTEVKCAPNRVQNFGPMFGENHVYLPW